MYWSVITLQYSLVSPLVSLVYLHLMISPYSFSFSLSHLACISTEGWMCNKSGVWGILILFCSFTTSTIFLCCWFSYFAISLVAVLFILFFLVSLFSLPVYWILSLLYHSPSLCLLSCNPRAIPKCINIWKNNLPFLVIKKLLFNFHACNK